MPAANVRGAPAPTRQRILDEAERLIAIKGVYGFTLRDIAVPLDVQVPAIYKHYKSRDDVLVEVSRRYIGLLATQFAVTPLSSPGATLRATLDAFVDMMLENPAYARLALVDFATPGGGMDYVKLAAGGAFKDNFLGGPLAGMHTRLRRLLREGVRRGDFRAIEASDLYRFVKAQLLIRLVFPDDHLLSRCPSPMEVRSLKRWLWDAVCRHLAPGRAQATGPLRQRPRNRARKRSG